MRRNYLPFGLITVFLGLSMLFISVMPVSGQTGNLNQEKIDRLRWESIRANQHTGVVNPLDVLKARQQAEEFRTKSTEAAMNLSWINAGPDNYPGLVWSAIFDNTDPEGLTIIAGTEAGGIWKSTNLGLTWTQMAVENNAALRVSSFVQTTNGTIYAATGIMNCKVVALEGNGIYRSENGGTFQAIPATQSNSDFSGVTKLAVDPISNRLFAATFGGLYFSDNGNDWSLVKPGYAMDVCVGSDGSVITAVGDSAYLSNGGNLSSWVTLTTGKQDMLPQSGIGWMVFAIAPSDPNILYASLANTDGRLLSIYTSINKGVTWSVIFPNNPAFEPFGGAGCYANTLAVFPDDPNKIYLGGIYMWYGRRIQPSGYFNWEMVSFGAYSPWYPNSAPALLHSFMFRPNYNNQLVLATDGGVCLGTNGVNGLEFQTSNKNLSSSQFYSLSFSAKKNFVMGGGKNIGSLALGFFYPTLTNGPRDGFPLLQPLGLYMGSNGGTGVWSNLNYNIGVFTVRSTTSTFQRQDFRDLTYANDFMNGITSVYTDYSPMHLWESFTFSQTRDSVKVFARAKPIPADTLLSVESANGINFPYKTIAPIAKGDSIVVSDPIASRFFFYGNKATIGYGKGILMTKDMLKFYKDPEYFIILKDTATNGDVISTFAVSADLNTLWAGTQKGCLYRLSGLINAQDSATANVFSSECKIVINAFSNTPFNGRNVTSISINPSNTSQVLVTLGNYGNQDYVYYSTDGNATSPTFTSVQSNLPKAPVFTGLIELHGNNAIVGTDVGVYSTNGLNTGNPQWGASMENIGDVIVTDIRQQVMRDYHILNYGVIYLASYGRGIWMDTTYYTPVGIEPVSSLAATSNTLALTPNPVKDQVNISYSVNIAGNIEVLVYDLTGRLVLNYNFGNRPKGIFNGILNVSNLPAGSYLVRVGTASGKLIKY
ncbi:MAG: T9SS type A sorting domain-containing protein [Bacteroidetes bacterium]|nr:T9SS type A sorting domain-containing protein [Bacteroidota bacterium]